MSILLFVPVLLLPFISASYQVSYFLIIVNQRCLAPTVVVNQSAKVYAAKGSQPYLHCGVRYDKKVNVTYKWYFKGNLLDRHSSRYIYRSVGPVGRLEIVGVYERDNGIYRCDSSSSVGKFSTDIELIVQGIWYF